MSQIASLYVIPDSALDPIRKAALPQKSGWLGKPKDEFWPTLRMQAGPSRLKFDYSGYAFVVLFEYLREKNQFDLEACENAEFAAHLSKTRQSYFVGFTPSQAEGLAAKLAALPIEDGSLAQFVVEFCGPDDNDSMTAAVIDAARILPSALREIQPGTIGLMNVG